MRLLAALLVGVGALAVAGAIIRSRRARTVRVYHLAGVPMAEVWDNTPEGESLRFREFLRSVPERIEQLLRNDLDDPPVERRLIPFSHQREFGLTHLLRTEG